MPKYINSSTAGNSLNLPYFHVISDNKDMTFSPRIYSDEQLFQLEYRQIGKKNENFILLYDF